MPKFQTKHADGIKTVTGKRVELENDAGATFFAYKSDVHPVGWWYVVEESTGLSIGKSPKTRKGAIEHAKRTLEKLGPGQFAVELAKSEKLPKEVTT